MPEALMFAPSGVVPNNPRLPALLYRAAFPADSEDMARTIEAAFAAHGWPPLWRNGIYPFHHYHCEGHEVLGIAAGHAEVLLGGEGGTAIVLNRGDAVLLPAGTGHCCRSHSLDFLVVGAYPPGQHADIRRSPATAALLKAIAELPFPEMDPLGDSEGLPRHWRGR